MTVLCPSAPSVAFFGIACVLADHLPAGGDVVHKMLDTTLRRGQKARSEE
jgi:hypothetical protein